MLVGLIFLVTFKAINALILHAITSLVILTVLIQTLANRIRGYGSNPWIALWAILPFVGLFLAFYYGCKKSKNKQSQDDEEVIQSEIKQCQDDKGSIIDTNRYPVTPETELIDRALECLVDPSKAKSIFGITKGEIKEAQKTTYTQMNLFEDHLDAVGSPPEKDDAAVVGYFANSFWYSINDDHVKKKLAFAYRKDILLENHLDIIVYIISISTKIPKAIIVNNVIQPVLDQVHLDNLNPPEKKDFKPFLSGEY